MPTTRNETLSVVLYGNTSQREKSQHIVRILNALERFAFTTFIDEKFARFLQQELSLDISRCTVVADHTQIRSDFAISVGGDGTFLQTAAQIGNAGIPIIGINTGHLGFLADVSPDDIDDAIEALSKKEYGIEVHSVLKVEIDGKPHLSDPYALNEVAILKSDTASLITIQTDIDQKTFTSYIADGLIIATPTGSTGYSLSANGPIISPDSHSICLTPIAPHSLSLRPFIINDDARIDLSVKSRTDNFLISIDGRSTTLSTDSKVSVSRANHYISVIKIRHQNFIDTLKDKLHWGIDER